MDTFYFTLFGKQISSDSSSHESGFKSNRPKQSEYKDRKEYSKAKHKFEKVCCKQYQRDLKMLVRLAAIEQQWKCENESPMVITATHCVVKNKTDYKKGRVLPHETKLLLTILDNVNRACLGNIYKYGHQVVGIQITRVYGECESVEFAISKVNDRGDMEDALKEGIQTCEELESE